MRIVTICFLFVFSFAFSSFAQNSSSVKGSIKDSTQQPLPFASMSLLSVKDSSLVKSTLSDEAGLYNIEQLKAGDYFLVAYSSGYKKYTSGSFHLNESEAKENNNIVLSPLAKSLKEVEIAAQKPFIEHFSDKTVVNVENSIVSAGSSVYEILERSPGVSMDQDGNISMRGKAGVNVMIDGKPIQMSDEQLANYLKGMQSSSVEKIELITNPSAKYDAAGTAGIINIKTKKGRKDGFNASVYSSYGQGRYEKENAGLSFNFKRKRFNWFGNYDFAKKRDFYNIELDRTFYNHDTATTRYYQNNYVVFPMNINNAKLGCDFYKSKKTIIGFMASGNSNRFNTTGHSNSETMDGKNELQYYFNTVNSTNEARENASLNLNFKHDIDTTGKEITADIDYAVYSNPIKQKFENTYIDIYGNEFQPSSVLSTNVKALLQIYSGKIDYVHPFSPSLKLETGIKSSYVNADNDKIFYNTLNGVEVIDSSKTNHFIYDENINAAYVSLSKDYKKFSFQLGLRGEQTIVKGNQLTNSITFTRNYAQLFPNASTLFKLNDNHEFSFNYSRRINRPDYQTLNPFILYVDPTFIKQGNPYLDAELTDNFELGYSYKQILNLLAYYNYNDKTIGTVLLQDNVNKITTQTEQNMNHVQYYGLSLTASLKPFKWWNNYNDLSYYHGTYNGVQQGLNYETGNDVFSINTTNSFILPKGFSAEVSYFYKTKEVYGLLNMNGYSSLNAGIKKVFLDKKLITKISFNDILQTLVTSGSMVLNNINESFTRKNETHVITFYIAYNIGKGGATARHQSGAEDEKKRAGAG